jgi:DNA-binding NarL/FixJ family response regulator
MNTEITCVLADDHPAVLDSVGRYLAAEGVAVVGAAANGNAAEALVLEHRPDVALLDAAMPDLSGVEVLRRTAYQVPETAIVLYTGSSDAALAREALDAGARGFVRKDAPLADVLRAINTVVAGGVYIDPCVAGALRSAGSDERALSPRELDVLRLLAEGLRYAEIGKKLFISDETVRTHVQHATAKLGARSRTEAVVLAVRKSLIA